LKSSQFLPAEILIRLLSHYLDTRAVIYVSITLILWSANWIGLGAEAFAQNLISCPLEEANHSAFPYPLQ
jgi:hypothetical protein